MTAIHRFVIEFLDFWTLALPLCTKHSVPTVVRLEGAEVICRVFTMISGDDSVLLIYRPRAIISRGLYIFYPISKDNFFVSKEVFSENSVLMYGLYSRAACNQERLKMTCVWYQK